LPSSDGFDRCLGPGRFHFFQRFDGFRVAVLEPVHVQAFEGGHRVPAFRDQLIPLDFAVVGRGRCLARRQALADAIVRRYGGAEHG
jgi:hypothetical protein